ncbi:MAG TPA: hypothetical protein VI485_05910 [Vicinamibacterales bacterium]|nr:hypothetical protein [Vicinamibacterales bacterium]
MRHLLPLVLLSCVLSATCVRDVRYRYFPGQPCGTADCVNLPAQVAGPGWEMAFAEFKDDGSAWDPLQTEAAIELIKRAQADNGAAVVLLYVHGWKNNANDAPAGTRKDVEKFRTALNRVALMVSHLKHDNRLPPLVGIYIGWRGSTVTLEPGKTLSLWSRRATARRVGRSALFDAMKRIVEAAKPAGDTRSRLILVGHSFGARVLENAVDGLDAENATEGPMLAWQRSLGAPGTINPAPPADLVVFVNAATQSTISGKTIQRLKDKSVVFYGPGGSVESCKDDPAGDRRAECRPLPLYVAVSSTGDLATRYLLPIANTLIPAGPLPLRLRAAAFTGRLQSHVVTQVDCPPPVPYQCDPSRDLELCFEATRDEQRVCYQVQRKKNGTNHTPFWAMTVDPRVVTDHGDIWNQNLLNLFVAVLERSKAADRYTTRTLTTGS